VAEGNSKWEFSPLCFCYCYLSHIFIHRNRGNCILFCAIIPKILHDKLFPYLSATNERYVKYI